jgi:hypothetical protein
MNVGLRPAIVAIGSVAWLWTAFASGLHAQQPSGDIATGASARPGPDAEVSFTTRLEKTAVWVGDRFHYQIFVDHSPNIQFILDNVNTDTINLDPLRVVNVTTSTMPLKDGNARLVVDLTLASFVTGVADLQIPQLSLFYFRRGGTTASATSESAAAESLTIPGPVIAVRSTLPPRASELRDAVTVSGWPRSRWIVSGVGWSALVLLVAGLTWRAVHVVRGRQVRTGPDRRKAMAAIRERWLESVPSDFADPSAVMEFYGRSYRDLKEYLGYLLETPTEGLLADELRAEMTRLAASPDLTERTARVLSICESARYARHPAELNGAAARELADDMRSIFQTS